MTPAQLAVPFAQALLDNVGQVLFGKRRAAELATVALLAEGHVLIEDVPGTGKTLLARALARSLDLSYQRIQCTADLLPADMLGGNVYHPGTGAIEFRQGPVFASVLVADELNRTPPRTQSALLQCMQERRVTIDRTTHELPDPFFVVATQNPLSFAGTYPLPESQLDRFALRVSLGHPEPDDELRMLERGTGHRAVDALRPVADADAVRAARGAVDEVRVDPAVLSYVVDLAQRTRTHPGMRAGVSARGTQALHRCARARALLHGREFAVPHDVQALLLPVFAHRVVPASATADGGHDAAVAVLQEILTEIDVPE